jgi:hypothetical protein
MCLQMTVLNFSVIDLSDLYIVFFEEKISSDIEKV